MKHPPHRPSDHREAPGLPSGAPASPRGGIGFRLALLGVVAAFVAGCAAPISVRAIKPKSSAAHATAPADWEERLGLVREAWEAIRRGESGAAARYNDAVARLVEALERSGADPWTRALATDPSAVAGIRRLEGRHPGEVDPIADRLIPVDTLRFKGEFAEHRAVVAGIGAPVVAAGSLQGGATRVARDKLPLLNATAVVRFEADAAVLELIDPYASASAVVAGRRFPLAADYGAAVMFGLSKLRIDKLGLVRLLRPARYADTAHLNFLQPFDPDRIPVLFVHGLDSTPATFAPMYFELLGDETIRRNYQFWVFSYPSGYPYPFTASLLRRELDAVAEAHPDALDLVVVAHSMGCLISRLMVTDAGDTLWRKAFGRPVDETPIRGRSRELLEECLVFENRDEIERVVFISGPHRGSELASNWIGRAGARFVKLPAALADARNALLSAATIDTAALHLGRIPNSIDTLSPDNTFVVEVAKLPIAEGATYHSIMGDRGRGDTPESSDGVVAYWSSHLDGAASERIVPSGHPAHQHPEGIEEVRRILHEHLAEEGRSSIRSPEDAGSGPHSK